MPAGALVPPGGIPSLDGIRTVSVLIVFLSHCGLPGIPGGFGVTVFFFLSGFLITRLFCAEAARHGHVSLRAFYLRRIVRLSPPLFATLALVYGGVALGIVPGEAEAPAVLSQIFYYFNYYAAAAGEVSGVAEGTGLLWSLAVEEHFYLVWPLVFVAFAGGRIGLGTVALILLLILLWRVVRFEALDHSAWAIYRSTDTRLDSLLFGCLLALMDWRGLSERVFPQGHLASLAVLGGAMAVLGLCFVVRDETFRATLRYSLQGLALMPVFHYCIARPQAWYARPLNWGWMRRIGTWSYSIYLVHYTLILTLLHLLGRPLEDGLLVAPVALALSIGWAWLLYRTVEAPARSLRRRLSGH